MMPGLSGLMPKVRSISSNVGDYKTLNIKMIESLTMHEFGLIVHTQYWLLIITFETSLESFLLEVSVFFIGEDRLGLWFVKVLILFSLSSYIKGSS